MADGIPPHEALAQLARLLEDLHGEATLRLDLGGMKVRWRVVNVEKADRGRLPEIELNVLRAACEHAEEKLTGEELAKAAGYQYNGSFRAALSHLRRGGFLSGTNSDPGYQATDKAFEHLE